MKKVYLAGTALLFAGASFAQVTNVQPAQVSSTKLQVANATHANKEDIKILRGGACTYGGVTWSEDFDIGTTGPSSTAGPTFTTANGAWTATGANGNVWKHSFFTTSGAFSAGTGAPGTPTESNGFMLFDVDSMNVVDGSYLQRTGYLESPNIDCSGLTTVVVTVNQALRYCCTGDLILGLEVSTDGGSSWGTTHDLLGGTEVNDDFMQDMSIGSSTMTDYSVDITTEAALSSTVMIRLVWDGLSATSVTHYYWVVDDICVGPRPGDDLWITQWYHESTATQTIFGEEVAPTYYDIPSTEIDGITFYGTSYNFGDNVATNVTLDVSAQGGAYTSSSTPITQLNGSEDTVSTGSYTPPATSGLTIDFNYALNHTAAASEAVTVNHARAYNIDVTDGYYSCDDDFYTGSGWWNGETTPGVNVNGFDLGNVYHMTTNETLYGVEVVCTGNTDAGVLIFPRIYEWDDIAGDFVLAYDGQGPDEYTIVAGDIPPPGDGPAPVSVYLPLSTPFGMVAGGYYLVCAGHYGGGAEAFVIAGGGHTDFAHALMYNYTATAAPFWIAGFDTAPMVRAWLRDPLSVGINELELEGVSLYQNVPNPADGTTTITYDLEFAANVTFDVVDVTGKTVYSKSQGDQNVGTYTIQLDADQLANGIYYYSLNVNGNKITKKMVVAQ